MNSREKFIALLTITRKEVVRFFRIWPQTLFPPIVTQSLYFVIFGQFVGERIGEIHGLSYIEFIIPGLVMMAVINNSFANVVGSFFSSKFQRNVEELMVSSTPNWVILAGYALGGTLRGIVIGILVFTVSVFFTMPTVSHIGIIFIFVVLTSLLFSLGGLLNGIFAKKFDDVSIFPTFVLTPLTYLGGVFYSIEHLPHPWRDISKLNPILYMVDGFRYGFYGISDVPVLISIFLLLFFTAVLTILNLYYLNRGTGLKS
jgi:ABC-2 type transport system permease protein